MIVQTGTSSTLAALAVSECLDCNEKHDDALRFD